MFEVSYKRKILHLKKPLQLATGLLYENSIWILKISNIQTSKYGIGECNIFNGLSIDNPTLYKEKLNWLKNNINESDIVIRNNLKEFPSIIFGWEIALRDLNVQNHVLFPSLFTKGIKPISINGIIWQNEKNKMKELKNYFSQNRYKTIKIKINPLNADIVLDVITKLRKKYPAQNFTIRLDANGSFQYNEVLSLAKTFVNLNIQAIEQPIAKTDIDNLTKICQYSPISVALDEQLIGTYSTQAKETLLQTIKPQYIVIKPSLLGGWLESAKWIEIANKLKIGWWVTSALESNIGINAIAQWLATIDNRQCHGLDTIHLYANNFSSPLVVKNGKLWYDNSVQWNKNII